MAEAHETCHGHYQGPLLAAIHDQAPTVQGGRSFGDVHVDQFANQQKPVRIALVRSGGALLLQSVSELPRNVLVLRRQRPLRHSLAHGRHQDIVLLKPFERPRAIEIR
jgi:hypothetical protein